jgi:beta-lactamase superfamily II metal-dependent hydrolase
MLTLQILKAFSGDALLLSFEGIDEEEHHILIDGGMPNTYTKYIKKALRKIEQLDAVFITHIDKDHIGGILKLLDSSQKEKVQNIFFNSGKMIKKSNSTMISESDGVALVDFINSSENFKSNREEITTEAKAFEFFGLDIAFLSPSYEALEVFNQAFTIGEVKEEALISQMVEEVTSIVDLEQLLIERPFREKRLKDDPANGASLSMLIRFQEKTILLLGDAKDAIIIASLKKMGYSAKNRLRVDYLKLAHHGSRYHTSEEFLALVECQHYIISTNGRYGHPNIETLARVLCHGGRDRNKRIYLYYNYDKEVYKGSQTYLLSEEEEERYNCEVIYDCQQIEL